MALDAEYICPACGGSGEVAFGREAPNGEHVDAGMSPCWACNHLGHTGEEQVFRHRLNVLARKLAERAIALDQNTPLKQKAFALEGEKHRMDVETFAEVRTMDAQGHFETELSKLRPDLIETIFDLLDVPKPERWVRQATTGEIPF